MRFFTARKTCVSSSIEHKSNSRSISTNAGNVEGTYGIPAGRIRLAQNEKPIETAVRELYEETGITIESSILTQLPTHYRATLDRSDGSRKNFEMIVFAGIYTSGKLRKSKETTPEWVVVARLHHYNLLRNVLDMINEGIMIL